jgi:hypothetical protein
MSHLPLPSSFPSAVFSSPFTAGEVYRVGLLNMVNRNATTSSWGSAASFSSTFGETQEEATRWN